VGARGRLIAAGLGFLVLAGGAAYVTGIIHLPITCEGPTSPVWGAILTTVTESRSPT